MRKNLIHIGLAAAFGICLAASLAMVLSCVKEYPEDGAAVDPTAIDVTINLTAELSVMQGSVLEDYAGERPSYLSFIMEIYKDDFSSEAVLRSEEMVQVAPDGTAHASFRVLLQAGTYQMAVFAAGAEDAEGGGVLYDCSSLAAIVMKDGKYTGSSFLRECYDLRMTLDFPASGEWFREETVEGVLSAPVGRVEVLAEDAEEFVTKMKGQSEGLDPAMPKSGDEAFWNSYSIQWSYTLYCPNGYNVLTGRPNKSETGIWFNSVPRLVQEGEALLGYDYIFVNGDSTTVDMALVVIDTATDEVVNTYTGLKVDVYKGRTSVIRGNFLTVEQGSGIGIDPDFEDVIDIILPD